MVISTIICEKMYYLSEKKRYFEFLIRHNIFKAKCNHNPKEKVKKIMHFGIYNGFSMIAPWCYYRKSKFFKNFTSLITHWLKSRLLDI